MLNVRQNPPSPRPAGPIPRRIRLRERPGAPAPDFEFVEAPRPAMTVTAMPGMVPMVIHRLTPRGGLDLTVALADALDLLGPQLERPERLMATHRLPCRADIFATLDGTPWRVIEESVAAALVDEAPVAPLTAPLAERLGLTQFLRAPAPVVSLAVRHDPSADFEPPIPAAAEPARAMETPGALTRREAVAAAKRARRADRSLVGRIRRWFRRGRVEGDRKVFFRALAGRPLGEQLWTCRPTPALLLDDATRAWVGQSLRLAGEDPAAGLKEWEIHWRRQGV